MHGILAAAAGGIVTGVNPGLTVGELAGQLNVSGIAYGSLSSATIGYWVAERFAGKGLTPTAVARAMRQQGTGNDLLQRLGTGLLLALVHSSIVLSLWADAGPEAARRAGRHAVIARSLPMFPQARHRDRIP